MDIRQIADQFFVSPQVQETDLAPLRDKGVASIICNRPDGEDASQPTFQQVAAAAEKLGMKARHIPVSGGVFSDEDVAAFGQALHEMPKPVLAYCRSGTRSATLWALANADNLPVDEILSATNAAGYDVTGLVERIANGTPQARKLVR